MEYLVLVLRAGWFLDLGSPWGGGVWIGDLLFSLVDLLRFSYGNEQIDYCIASRY